MRKSLFLLFFLSPMLGFGQFNGVNDVGAGTCTYFKSTWRGITFGSVFHDRNLPLSIMTWVRKDSSQGFKPVFLSNAGQNGHQGIWLRLDNDAIEAGFGDGGSFANASRRVKTAVPGFSLNNRWIHICAVLVNANDIRIYVNGIDVGGTYSGAATSMQVDTTGIAFMGRSGFNSNPINYFEGYVDAVRFFNRALSTQEIRKEMSLKADTSLNGVIALWEFDNDTILLTHDQTGNYHGTLLGGYILARSGAAIGDTAIFSYPFSGAAQSLMWPGFDSIAVSSPNPLQGLHIYRVDEPPYGTTVLQAPYRKADVDHYYGVYSVNLSENFDIRLSMLPPSAQPETYQLVVRPDGSHLGWHLYNKYLNDTIHKLNRGFHEQYWVIRNCIESGGMPAIIQGCDSVTVQLNSNYPQAVWSDGSTALQRTFYNRNTLMVRYGDSLNCIKEDTIRILVFKGQFNAQDDRRICDSTTVSIDPSLQSIIWNDGDTLANRVLHDLGLYWYEAIDIYGCTIRDTFEIKSKTANYLPETYLGCDSVTVNLPWNLSNPIWSDGSREMDRTFYQTASYTVIADDTSTCKSRDTLTINILLADFNPIPNQAACDSLWIKPDPNLQDVYWLDGYSGSGRYISETGNYIYEARHPQTNCIIRDTFHFESLGQSVDWSTYFRSSPETHCVGDTLKLMPPENTRVLWPNGSDSIMRVFANRTLRLNLGNACGDTVLYLDYQFFDCACEMHIAKAFTPNGDQLNDEIRPLGLCEIKEYHWQIYNRWGQMVFETHDPEVAFDGNYQGQACPEGTYIYKLQVSNEYTFNKYQGVISILR